MTVTLYRVYSGFANVCDGISIRKPESDTIYAEAEYQLPEGFRVDVDDLGLPQIYDKDGFPTTPCLRNNRKDAAVYLVRHDGSMVQTKKKGTPQKRSLLREARMQAGLTMQQLADMVGIHYRLIQRIERGESKAANMTAKNLIDIADALGVDPRELIADEG